MVPSFTHTSDEEADLYRSVLFGDGPGALIIKGCFDKSSMQRLAALLQNEAGDQAQHANAKHPLQQGKRIMPAALEHISKVDPSLALTILTNSKLNGVIDAVLGHAYIASLTGHTLLPGASQQKLHTDYPGHIYSGKFWEKDPEKFKQHVTQYARQHVLPCSAIQGLIAPIQIGYSNGGTLLVQASHRVPDIDLLVHEPVWQQLNTKQGDETNMLVCPELDPGDVLLFNRGIAHCGGANATTEMRPALIAQWSPFYIVPQHAFDQQFILQNLNSSQKQESPDASSLSELERRLVRPFPVDNRKHN